MTQTQTATLLQPRQFERVRPDKQPANASILGDAGQPAIECDVIDHSAGGACLEIRDNAPVPQRFELVYGDMRKKCRIVWTRGARVGVVF